MIKVSVIIPTCNRRHTLGRALRSVLSQQDVVFEVLVVDDGSTDGTAEWLEKEFPSVVCLRQNNAGPAAARNTGIRSARGPWLAFLDSDDVWESGKLAAQLAFFRENPQYRICQTEEIWIRNGKRVNPMNKHRKSGGHIFERCLELCLISPSAVMMHRDLMDESGLFDESYPACEDYELWLRITAREPVGLIETPYVIKYGGHTDQRSREFPAMDRFRIRAMLKTLRSGLLNESQRLALLTELEAKTGVLIQGALKRGKEEEASALRALVTAARQNGIADESVLESCFSVGR